MAANHVQVFMMYADRAIQLSDADLSKALADLNRRGIALGIALAPLTSTATCGRGIEGFSPDAVGVTLRVARRIQAAGGKLQFIRMDEPFSNASPVYTGPGACQWSAEKVAREVGAYIKAVKSEFPDVVIGDVEAWTSVNDIERWIEAYRTVNGESLSFLHWDVNWRRPDWAERAKALEYYAREHGVPFGMIYNGNGDATSDAQWMQQAEEHMTLYETLAGGRPDHAIFQSWHAYPKKLLPETDPSKHTYLINRYFHTRTTLSLDLSEPSSDGSREVTGRLTEAAGTPVAGVPVELSIMALDGPGQFAEYTATGVVPAGATQAVVGFRVNTEGGGPGSADFFLYEIRYAAGSQAAQQVPNGDFSQGLQRWGLVTRDTVRLEPSDRGSGQMLHITAGPNQRATINSSVVPVSAGALYTVTFAARVPPASAGSGYFAITFAGASGQILRTRIQLEPPTRTFGATTDGSGAFRLQLSELPFALHLRGLPFVRLRIDAQYAGDSNRWAAYTRVTN